MKNDSTKVKFILFDLDGVLFDSLNLKGEIFIKVFSSYSQFSSKIMQFHLANGGVPRRQKIEYIYKLITESTPSEETLDALTVTFSNILNSRLSDIKLFPGASQVLASLTKMGYKLFSISSMPTIEAESILQNLEIKKFFNGILETSSGKIAAVSKFIQRNSVVNNNIIYVGDSREDFICAKTFDLTFILVNNENFDEVDRNTLKIQTLKELTSAVSLLEKKEKC